MEELTDWWERVNDHREFRVTQTEMEANGIAFNIGNSCFPRDIVKGMKSQTTDLEKALEDIASPIVFYQRHIER